MRSGEVVVPSQQGYDPMAHLSFGDVRVDSITNPQCIEIWIKASKTDPFCEKVSIYLGRTDNDLCPVAASLDFMVPCRSTAGPFFTFTSGSYLTREKFVCAVRAALDQVSLVGANYAGNMQLPNWGSNHGSPMRGVQHALIKVLGR